MLELLFLWNGFTDYLIQTFWSVSLFANFCCLSLVKRIISFLLNFYFLVQQFSILIFISLIGLWRSPKNLALCKIMLDLFVLWSLLLGASYLRDFWNSLLALRLRSRLGPAFPNSGSQLAIQFVNNSYYVYFSYFVF